MTQQSASAKPPRRTQAERSETMRRRLIEATLICLARDGYVGTTFSQIITEAGVSRGAPLHHFPTKAALIEAAAEQLMRNLYARLGESIADLVGSTDRLGDMIMASWKQLSASQDSVALLELTLASRRDPELAEIMKRIGRAGFDALDIAAQHYFEPLAPDVNPIEYFVMTHWLIQGMAIGQNLLPDAAVQQHFLALWSSLMGQHLRPRPGVTVPPPRPQFWQKLKEHDGSHKINKN